MAIWIELARPYSTLKVLVWMLASCTESGLGVRFSTPGPDRAGHIQPIHHVHVSDAACAVGAGIHLQLRGVIVHARPGTAAGDGAFPDHARRQRDQRNHIAARQREAGQRRGFERHLVAAFGRVQHGDFAGNLHRLRCRGHLHRHRDIQILAGFQGERDRGGVEAAGLHGDLVGAGGEADKPVIALRVRRRRETTLVPVFFNWTFAFGTRRRRDPVPSLGCCR